MAITVPILLQHFGLSWAEILMIQQRVWDLITQTPPFDKVAQTLTRAIQRRLRIPQSGILDYPTQRVLTSRFGSSAWTNGSWYEVLLFLDNQPPGAARAFARF